MASQQEFRRANEIINLVKRADGQNANLFDVLDRSHTSQWWWKDHKKWLFYRFPQLTLQKIEGNDYLIYSDINNNNNNNSLKKNIIKKDTLSTLHSSKEIKI